MLQLKSEVTSLSLLLREKAQQKSKPKSMV